MKRRKSGGTHRIPSSYSGESISTAVRIRPRRDVVEACETIAVQPEVEKAERRLAGRNPVVIQQGDDARHGLYVGCQQGARGRRMQREDVSEGEVSHRGRAARAIHGQDLLFGENTGGKRLCGDIGNATAIRAAQITKGENGSGRATVANALENAIVLAAEVPEEAGHDIYLVGWPRKVIREAATGESRRSLRIARRAADASDKGTCENRGRCSERYVPALAHHTYKLRGRWGGIGHACYRLHPLTGSHHDQHRGRRS